MCIPGYVIQSNRHLLSSISVENLLQQDLARQSCTKAPLWIDWADLLPARVATETFKAKSLSFSLVLEPHP